MKTAFCRPVLLFMACALPFSAACAQTLAVHPQNPHIFTFRGKPLVIVGSGEHYGAVMNADFDYHTYLKTLQEDGLNTTRLFTGPYREGTGSFGIEKNTMGVPGDRYLSPWARSSICCYAEGGNKFDLSQWDEAYFSRLKSFLQEAGERGIIVEVVLFTSFYGANWPLSPFHPGNNINGTEDLPYQQVQTLEGRSYLPLQEAYVRKMVRELNGFDNIYFEIQNEPWADNGKDAGVWNDYIQPDLLQNPGQHWRNRIEPMNDAAYAWHVWVAGLIRDEEAKLPGRHLISVNYCNFKVSIPQLDPNFDIVNFHYGMPEAVELNRHWARPIGFNETGFCGNSDDPYRRQAWRFMMSGGSLFNHLDYSFSVGFENGQDRHYEAPGGGSPELRRQLRLLLEHLMALDLPQTSPERDLIAGSPGAFSWAMTDRSGRWLVYCEAHAPFGLQLSLPDGSYRMRWTDVRNGEVISQEVKQSQGGTISLAGLPAMEAVLLIEAD